MKMRLSAWLMLALHVSASGESAAHFGPGGCVSAWLSESKSCVVQTSCAKHAAQLASYALRLVCVGHDGGRVLHSFQEGTFDAEETFDTHITCQRCDSGDDVEPVTAVAPAALAKERSLVTVNASELQGLEEEVKLLKSSMVSMAKVVAQLKLQVTSKSAAQPHGLRGSAVTNATVAAPVPNVTAPVLLAPVPNVTAPVLLAPVPNVTAPVLLAPEINTSFFLREALAASANTTRSAAGPAPPMRVQAPSGTSGALNPTAALRTLRKRGASFLGVDRLDSAERAALAASVASAQKEAEEAALQAEKDAEALTNTVAAWPETQVLYTCGF
ncbi:unnamed protein product [Cladocopium goreaui]|uniref:Uncharacterized protein n=1 Tax=Cladocopium goreaui TaxID=2562237 RepID=A0A9P1BWE8_9DINO|nr:unnamed protein product [Cladocopium goreaui]